MVRATDRDGNPEDDSDSMGGSIVEGRLIPRTRILPMYDMDTFNDKVSLPWRRESCSIAFEGAGIST